MTAFFTYTGDARPAGGSKSTDWPGFLETKFRMPTYGGWRSAAERLRRIIDGATHAEPTSRLTISEIHARLKILSSAVRGDFDALTPDVWAEELLSRSAQAIYHASESGDEFTREPRRGRTITARGDLRGNAVLIHFRNLATEATNRTGVDRLWSGKLESAREILISGGWEIVPETRHRNLEISLIGRIPVPKLRADFDKVLRTLNRGLDQVRLD
jgi:eukaryotic-like serine/threonine-protein kinase